MRGHAGVDRSYSFCRRFTQAAQMGTLLPLLHMRRWLCLSARLFDDCITFAAAVKVATIQKELGVDGCAPFRTPA